MKHKRDKFCGQLGRSTTSQGGNLSACDETLELAEAIALAGWRERATANV